MDLLLLHFSSSWKVETALSAKAIAEVSAAKKTKAKKRIPTTRPKPMLAKIFGIVINIREGPAFNTEGSPLEKAKTAGIIISPAKTAMAVSKTSTWLVDSSIERSDFI